MNLLSRSVVVMFLFDLLTLLISTTFWYTYFGLPMMFIEIIVFLTVLTGLATLFLKDNYKIREFNITHKNTYLLFEGMVFTHIPTAVALLFITNWMQESAFILANLITTFFALRVYRAMFHFYLFNIKKTKNILIIGTDENARIMADEIANKKALKMNVIGFVEDTQKSEELVFDDETKIFKQPCDIAKVVKENNVDIVIVAIKRRMEEQFLTDMVFGIPRNVKVYKMPSFYEMVTGKYYIDEMSINWLFYDFMRNRSPIYDFCKRAFDIIAASIVLAVTFPILAYIAIRVKLTDGGNPVFTQDRVGRGGKIFKVYKLRTMYVNDYKPKDGEDIKYAESVKGDDRIIPFCRFVRKARFDEIPQMINILKGEMSIVGPRAEWDREVQIFSKEISYYPCRMWVRTGWTGWSHVNMEPVFTVDEERERLAYDLYYLKHRNVLWEIGILVKAVFLAVGGRHK